MKPIPTGRFNMINGLPCLTAGIVAVDWENRYRVKGRGYFPRKEEGAFLHLVLRRQDSRTRTWALWDGGAVLTGMPIDTDEETLRRAARYIMEHLYWHVRDFKGWESVLAAMSKISPQHFPEAPGATTLPSATSTPGPSPTM